jgi:hypothetical protein
MLDVKNELQMAMILGILSHFRKLMIKSAFGRHW